MLGIANSYKVKTNRHALYLCKRSSSWYVYIGAYLFFYPYSFYS